MCAIVGAKVARPYPTVITVQWKKGKEEQGGVGQEEGEEGVRVSKGQSGSVSMDTWWLWCPSMLLGVTAGSGWLGLNAKPVNEDWAHFCFSLLCTREQAGVHISASQGCSSF